MRAVVQRVRHAEVKVDGETVGKCGAGFLVLLGVAEGDSEAEAELLCRKIVGLRVFADEAGKMNRSVTDIGGELLVVSQFTLLANCRRGNRRTFWHPQSLRKPRGSMNTSLRRRKRPSRTWRPACSAPIWRSPSSMTAPSPSCSIQRS